MAQENNFQEPTNKELLEAINGIAVAQKETSGKLDGLSTRVDGISDKFDGLSTRVDGLSISQKETSITVAGLVVANREILEAINEFASTVDKRFDSLETRTTKIEALMVTKDYLDDKLAILRGDVLHVIRKEDSRVTRLIEILYKKTVITNDEVKILEELQPLTSIV